MFQFPDVEAILVELDENVTTHLTDLSGTVHHVYSLGGQESGPLRYDRVGVDTYAQTRNDARTAAESLKARLTAGPVVTDSGLIDEVTVDQTPHEVPYQDSVSLYQAQYRIHTRAI